MKSFYVVVNGRKNGIYTEWETAKKQVSGFRNAIYKGFKTRAEAELWYTKKTEEYLRRKVNGYNSYIGQGYNARHSRYKRGY